MTGHGYSAHHKHQLQQTLAQVDAEIALLEGGNSGITLIEDPHAKLFYISMDDSLIAIEGQVP